ncbi:MAG: hypothetical protein V4487_08565 [Chlamydiota bacterium]
MEKYLTLDAETERMLHAICDQALKNGGMNMLASINQLIASIKQKGNE